MLNRRHGSTRRAGRECPALLPVYAPMPVRSRARPRLLAGGRGRPGMARRLRRPRGGLDGPQPSGRGARHRRAGGAAPVLLDGRAAAAARGARRAAGRALSRRRWGGCSSATRARRPTRTRCIWPGGTPAGRRSSRCAAAGTAGPPRRSPCTDGPRYEEAARRAGIPLSRKVPFDDVAALDAAVDDTRRGGAGRAGAGVRRRARLLAGVPRRRPPAVRRARGRPALRRGAVRRRPLRRIQRGGGVRRDARRAHLRQRAGRRTSDRRGRREPATHRRARARRPGQHLRRRAGALRGGARQHRGDRARRAHRQRGRGRRAPLARRAGARRSQGVRPGTAAGPPPGPARRSRCSARCSSGGS